MAIGVRIKKVRKGLDLTQQEFADKIGSKRNTVATYEMGRTEPSAAVISLICREFNVSEEWLRTGKGEMFIRRSKDEELSAFMNGLLADETSDFRRRLMSALSRLNTEQWEALESVVLQLAADLIPAAKDDNNIAKIHVAARDGSRLDVDVPDGLSLPEESAEIPE